MKKIAVSIALLISAVGYSQNYSTKPKEYPQVGRPMPDFALNDVQGYSKKEVRLSDFRGKWLVLDWWTKYCMSCIESFPKMNALQKEFGDQFQFLFVSYTGTFSKEDGPGDQKVRTIYDRASKTLNLTVPFAFDSTLYQRYNLGSPPYIVVIDPNGIVRGITSQLHAENIRSFLDNKPQRLHIARRMDEMQPRLDQSIPFLTYDNGGSDTAFMFRSLLSLYEPGVTPAHASENIYYPDYKGKFEIFPANPAELYRYAYLGKGGIRSEDTLYGKFFGRVVAETKDSISFFGTQEYCYALKVPQAKAGKQYMMQVMQRDLMNYFGYQASVETRKVPCWRLIATDEARKNLVSNGKKEWNHVEGTELAYKGYPMHIIINQLHGYYDNITPFLDETGITGNVDLPFPIILNNFTACIESLRKCGLDLLPAEKEMKVIVVKDPK